MPCQNDKSFFSRKAGSPDHSLVQIIVDISSHSNFLDKTPHEMDHK